MYLGDPTETGRGSRFKWFVSTCLAAAVGVGTIGIVLVGSSDLSDRSAISRSDPNRSVWERIWDLDKMKPVARPLRRPAGQVELAGGKGDRLETVAGGMITRHIIHDSDRQRRGDREFIQIKPYSRIVARLSTVSPPADARVPPFNPFRLYSNSKPIAAGETVRAEPAGDRDGDVAVKMVELLGGFLPEDDGQEIGNDEASKIVSRSDVVASSDPSVMRQGIQTDQADTPSAEKTTAVAQVRKPVADALPPNVTVITRTSTDGDGDDVEGRETRSVRVSRGATLMSILRDVGAEIWQARAIVDMANTTFPLAEMKAGQEVRMVLDPSPTNEARVVPVRVSVFSEAHRHLVTVSRNSAGEYVVAGNTMEADIVSAQQKGEQSAAASLYASIYHASLSQGLGPQLVEKILRINAYDVDFKRRVRPGDGFEFFFDLLDGDKQGEGEVGELLYTALTVGGETKAFYRFRSSDGVVDFYDRDGNNSKRFLNRRPVRSESARLTDGFGMRLHPLYRVKRMHTGIDWAAPAGTPIMAAGNGVIEESGRKGGYGNYLRIRHANGYKTAYGHMLKLATGVTEGVKVVQGQTIGYVGSTGGSTGNHLHFEVLVNNSFVDPARIGDSRQRRLTGKDRVAFVKERDRIMDLLHRAPVSTRVHTDKQDGVAQSRATGIATSAIVVQPLRK